MNDDVPARDAEGRTSFYAEKTAQSLYAQMGFTHRELRRVPVHIEQGIALAPDPYSLLEHSSSIAHVAPSPHPMAVPGPHKALLVRGDPFLKEAARPPPGSGGRRAGGLEGVTTQRRASSRHRGRDPVALFEEARRGLHGGARGPGPAHLGRARGSTSRDSAYQVQGPGSWLRMSGASIRHERECMRRRWPARCAARQRSARPQCGGGRAHRWPRMRDGASGAGFRRGWRLGTEEVLALAARLRRSPCRAS
jgi:hypothetical protein